MDGIDMRERQKRGLTRMAWLGGGCAGSRQRNQVCECFGDAIERLGRVLRCYSCGLCLCSGCHMPCVCACDHVRASVRPSVRPSVRAFLHGCMWGSPGTFYAWEIKNKFRVSDWLRCAAIASRQTLSQDEYGQRRSPSPPFLSLNSPSGLTYSAHANLRERCWISRSQDGHEKQESVDGQRGYGVPSETFSVATYNLLADCYASPSYFKLTHPSTLSWRNRKEAVLEVLDALDADILCLQEVDHFDSFLLPQMRARGYDGRFKKRNGPTKRDGCATFWRRDRLKLVQVPRERAPCPLQVPRRIALLTHSRHWCRSTPSS